ncbi:Molybdopterin molybdenumtransferase [Pigmentiphaga humi]|uniref:Molybdopterin molybdenumtransferase n=1 Tax=Pigmentiphaga humi TaxID=2478468 RepID=A0A3P4B7I6_9BURK|nr:gephyrin-like molybdotransferase Glp [Pigmentiphaga humi]VCU72012.1 Molybdopterin molybdenumtransferase [Pigmentiphaga humi]
MVKAPQNLLTLDQALQVLLAVGPVARPAERVELAGAPGRILAEDVTASIDVPSADNSAMDGYAVRTADAALFAAGIPVSQRIPAGSVPQPLAAGTAARIFTGAPIPAGADAVVMQEEATVHDDCVAFAKPVEAGAWVRPRGCDIESGSTILKAGARLRPQDVGLAASVGVPALPLRPLLRVATLFTGDELAAPGEPLAPGKIYNSNRYLLQGMLAALPVAHADLGSVHDSFEATRDALREAARHNDLVITTGGVSVGEEDHVKPAVEALGSLDMWSIALKPGKPLAFGRIRREDGSEAIFIGLPGNPVSSFVTFGLLLKPMLLKLAGATVAPLLRTAMRADFDWPKADRRREFMRVRRNAQGGLDLFPNQLSAVLTSTVWGDGVIDNPGGQAIRRGDMVQFISYADLLG